MLKFIMKLPAASRRVSKDKQTVSVVIATRECHCEGVKRPKQSKY